MKREKRFLTVTDIEIRATKNDENKNLRTIGGYVTKFNTFSENLGFFREVREQVAPGAFKKTLKEDDIRAFWNHNSDIILGRSTNGTLKLKEDNTGLAFDLDLPDTTAGRDAFISIERGDVTGMSFGFMVRGEEIDRGEDEKAPIIRTLTDIQLFEVSPVIFPAYPDSETEARDEGSLRHWAKKFLDNLEEKPRGLPVSELQARLLRVEKDVALQAKIIRY